MPKIVLVFDIDGTLFNSDNKNENEWIGSKESWLDLCFRLKNKALSNGVELNFAIATAKDRIDALVLTAAKTFKDYLVVLDKKSQILSPILQHQQFVINLFAGDEFDKYKSTISSFQIEQGPKSPSLERIAKLYDVNKFSDVYLVDDHTNTLAEAKETGFSIISAEGVCVPDKEKRDQNARTLLANIENVISQKIEDIKPNKSLFFTHVPEYSPLQKLILQGFEPENFFANNM